MLTQAELLAAQGRAAFPQAGGVGVSLGRALSDMCQMWSELPLPLRFCCLCCPSCALGLQRGTGVLVNRGWKRELEDHFEGTSWSLLQTMP